MFSVRGDKRIGVFENFQMKPRDVTCLVGSVEAWLLMMLSLGALCSCAQTWCAVSVSGQNLPGLVLNYDVHDPSRPRATCSSFLAMAAPNVAGTGLVGFAVAMATQYSGFCYRSKEERAWAAAQAGGKKKTHITVSVSLVLSVFKGEKG